MSSIGKIFVVLNLVLAAAFVGWAANAVSTSGDWKTKHDAVVATAGKDKMALEADLSRVRTELAAAKTDLTTAVNARDEAKRAQDRLTTENGELSARNTSLDASVTKIETTLAQISDSKDKAEADAKKAIAAQKDAEAARTAAIAAQTAAEAAQSAAEARLRDVEAQVAALEREKTKLVNESSSLSTQLDTLAAMTNTNLSDITGVDKIDGAVLGVDRSINPPLVAINAGSTKGVKRGHTFEIFDGGTYKGRVKIEFVHGDMSSGLISLPVAGQTINQGDSATTRL